MGIAIEKKLSDAGYKMLGDDTSIGTLIQDILKTEKLRYLKAIPLLIYKYNLEIDKIQEKIKKIELFNTILDITSRIFNELQISKTISRQNRGDPALEEHYASKFAPLYKEFKDEFEIQLRNENTSNLLIDTKKNDEERNLQYGLSQLFTKKEKYIIKRLQEKKPISKTDYEYYSRKTKKKIRSIIYLEDFAKNIYSKTPYANEDLFELKKQLEKWLSEEWKIIGFIEEFHLSKDKIIISLRKRSGDVSTNIWKLNKIKDKRIIYYLQEFQAHDFR